MRERGETLSLSFLSFLPRRERPLLAGNHLTLSSSKFTWRCSQTPFMWTLSGGEGGAYKVSDVITGCPY